jgi:hypothetical protein
MGKNWSRDARVCFSCRRGFCWLTGDNKPTNRSGDRKTRRSPGDRWQATLMSGDSPHKPRQRQTVVDRSTET